MAKLFLLLIFSHVAAYFLVSKITRINEYKNLVILSCAIIVVIMASRSALITFLLMIPMLYGRYKREQLGERVVLFFGMTLVLSTSEAVRIPFPGINYLADFSYLKMLVLILLLPVFFSKEWKENKVKFNSIDKAMVLLFLIICILDLRGPSLTNALRENIYFILTSIIPYFVIRRFSGNYEAIVMAILFALIAQAFVALFESVYHWRLYPEVEKLSGYVNRFNVYRLSREYGLRVGASLMDPSVLSFFMALGGIVSLSYVIKGQAKFYGMACFGLFFVALLFAGSRGALIGLLLGILIMVVLWRQRDNPRPFFTAKKMLLGGILGAIVAIMFFDHLASLDEYGTFEYRWRLLQVSWDVIKSSLLFGDYYYIEDPRLEVMRQGQGIIDIVNTYLFFAMRYGLPAGILLAYVLVGSSLKVITLLNEKRVANYEYAMVIVSWTVVTAFMILTTSPRGMLWTWMWIIVALGSSIISEAEKDRSSRDEHA